MRVALVEHKRPRRCVNPRVPEKEGPKCDRAARCVGGWLRSCWRYHLRA